MDTLNQNIAKVLGQLEPILRDAGPTSYLSIVRVTIMEYLEQAGWSQEEATSLARIVTWAMPEAPGRFVAKADRISVAVLDLAHGVLMGLKQPGRRHAIRALLCRFLDETGH